MRDKDFQKHVASFLSVGLVLFIASLFIDKAKIEPKREIAIIYKKPTPFKDAPNIKADQVAEVKMDNTENMKPEKVKSQTQEVKKEVKKVAKEETTKQKKISPTTASKKTPKSRAKVKVKKAIAKVDTYKFEMKNTVNSLFAKTGDLSDVKLKNVGSESSDVLNNNLATSGSLALKKANVEGAVGKLGKSSNFKANKGFGAKGLVDKKGAFTSYIEPKTVVLGSIDPELLRKILRQYLPQFRHCYQQELEYNSDKLQGVVDLDFRINQNGRVSKVKVLAKNARFSKKGTSCMGNVLKVIQFPKPKGGGVVDVRQPLNFYSVK